MIYVTKTIQVRVDERLKSSSDQLFASLGLDTSTAIRMFLVASNNQGGLPFDVAVPRAADADKNISDAIARREAGARFYTADESLDVLRKAIKGGVNNGE